MRLILHVVSVGISLLEHQEKPLFAADELPAPLLTVRDALQWAANGPRHELDWARLELAGLPRTQAAEPADLAAEWTSIHAVTDGEAQGRAFVFLATDTQDGMRAATLVAARYQGTATRYLHEPPPRGWPLLEPGDVCICRIPDLDLARDKPTNATWRALGAVGRLVADTALETAHGEWDVVVHLSGGYKAMIPYLMLMAEGIKSRLRDVERDAPHKPGIRVVIIHEDSRDEGIVIDFPVRSVEGDLLAEVKELAAVTRDRDDVRTGFEDLQGLLIHTKNGTRQLNPAGLIMVSML